MGDISDRFGRHKAFMLGSVGLLTTGCATAYMRTYWTILGFRIASVALANGLFMATFVLSMEMLGPSLRSYAGNSKANDMVHI